VERIFKSAIEERPKIARAEDLRHHATYKEENKNISETVDVLIMMDCIGKSHDIMKYML